MVDPDTQNYRRVARDKCQCQCPQHAVWNSCFVFQVWASFPITRPDFCKCASLWIGLYAVKVRAEAMQEASEAVPSGMLSVLGQPQSKFTSACLEAREHCKTLGIENPVCEVANYLFPDCRVISGHLEVGVDGNSLRRPQSCAEGWNGSTPVSPQLRHGCPAELWSSGSVCRPGVHVVE